MNRLHDEQGFTLIELIVTFLILSIATTTFLQVAFSGTRGSDVTRSVSQVAQEARLGLNRMVRDTREASLIESATADGYTVKIDFDGNGLFQNPNAAGDFEVLTFAFNNSDRRVTLNGELLVEGARRVSGKNMFEYTSNHLAYDWDSDGITSAAELDVSPTHGITGVGNNNGTLDNPELAYISSVSFALRVSIDGFSERFFGEAQLRNRR